MTVLTVELDRETKSSTFQFLNLSFIVSDVSVTNLLYVRPQKPLEGDDDTSRLSPTSKTNGDKVHSAHLNYVTIN